MPSTVSEPDAATFPITLEPLTADDLRHLARVAGADDAGVVAIDRPELAAEREAILAFAPWAKSLVALVCRMNREPIRSPARSVANLEFHHTGDRVNEVARHIVAGLEARGVRAINPAMGFPMEMDCFPDRVWVVSHKLVAEAAGLGRMGIHRNLIHPCFGNFILLGTVITDVAIDEEDRPIDFNPCLECKLCVSACPVGAIGSDGRFNFAACYTHNYREFMGGFTDWIEQVATSRNALDYRRRVSDAESASMWQSLSFGANYKAAYCMAVCPAGDDVIAPYRADRKAYRAAVVQPLVDREETVYVLPGSDAEAHVAKRFPAKTAKRVDGALRPRSIAAFLRSLPLVFNPGHAKGLDAIYHFTFTGAERAQATITIRGKQLTVEAGHIGEPNLRVTADSTTWLGFVHKEKALLPALLLLRIRLRGNPRLLVAFGRCFPS